MTKTDEFITKLENHNEKTDGEYTSVIELLKKLTDIQSFFNKK